MADDKLEPKVPTERPDPEAVARPSSGGPDRPGMDLGGSTETPATTGNVPESGPRGDPALGEGRPSQGSDKTTGGGTPA